MEESSVGANGKSVYDRLCDEHRALLDLCAEMTRICASPDHPDWAAYDDFRWRYSRQAVQHLCFKDQHVYLNLQASGIPAIEQLVKKMRAEQDIMHGVIQAHILKWPQDAIRKDWRGYARDSTRFLAQYNALLQMEATQLHPVVRQQEAESLTRKSQVRNWAGEIWEVRDAILKP